jgi:2-keto-4-pentenoate hydratase
MPEDLDLATAYQLQHIVSQYRSPNGVSGIKAGVTAKPVQKHFGLDGALLASLYDDAMLASGKELEYVEGRLLESEVALQIDLNSGDPIAIAPAFEIVAVRFASPEQMSAANLVACNLGADRYVVGEFIPWQAEYNDIALTLKRDGEVVNQTVIGDALDGPLPGAKWLVTEARRRGFTLDKTFTYMMGACGTTLPLEVGQYEADYGALGSLSLQVR